jgi:CBS domain-containing protein
MLHIQEIMTRPAITCRSTDTLHTAAQLMWDHDCGAIPVTDEAGKLVGIVTDRDICMATYTRGRAPQQIAVADAMAKQVYSCRSDDPVSQAEQLMSDYQIRRVPIVDYDDKPTGVLSLNDITRHVAATRSSNGERQAAIQTMSAICQHRPEPVEARA